MVGHCLTELQWSDFLAYTVRKGTVPKMDYHVGQYQKWFVMWHSIKNGLVCGICKLEGMINIDGVTSMQILNFL